MMHEVVYCETYKKYTQIQLVNIIVKQFLYRPGQALRAPIGWISQISRRSAHEGGKVVNLNPPENIPGTHSC
jgi:hypothetical protein